MANIQHSLIPHPGSSLASEPRPQGKKFSLVKAATLPYVMPSRAGDGCSCVSFLTHECAHVQLTSYRNVG